MSKNESERVNDAETKYEQLLHRLARFKADVARLEELARTKYVAPEIQGQLSLLASEYDTIIREVTEYIEGDGEMPDECPVCEKEIVEVDELEPGESYDLSHFCVVESTPGGPGHGVFHFEQEEA